jgi:hypothetical protein
MTVGREGVTGADGKGEASQMPISAGCAARQGGTRGYEQKRRRKREGSRRRKGLATGYCLSYTADMFIEGSEPFVVTVRDLPLAETATVPVMIVLPPFLMTMLSVWWPAAV